MCITVNLASLAGTKILSIPLENGNHFIAYSNKIQNLSGKPNAMILPIPGETNPEMFHNTESYKGFLKEITNKCRYNEDYRGEKSRGMESKSLSLSFELGQYLIGLSKGFDGIREFLDELPEDKRPEISEELKKFFEEKYSGWSFAVCVFDSDKTIDAQPIAFEYKPFAYNFVYFPTMDGHDGKAPVPGSMIKLDHTFIYEHTGKKSQKYYQDFVNLEENKVPDFLNKRNYRMINSSGFELNGDTFLDMKKLSESDFSEDAILKRVAPLPYRNI